MTGKFTISNILKIILKEAYNLETVTFSIDDFYKTLDERKNVKKINIFSREEYQALMILKYYLNV